METILWVTGGILSTIPFWIAYKRKCKNFMLINVLSFYLSWTIIGWVVAMAWAICGESDPEEFAKTTLWRSSPLTLG